MAIEWLMKFGLWFGSLLSLFFWVGKISIRLLMKAAKKSVHNARGNEGILDFESS